MAASKNFLLNEWNRANALKRGGGIEFIALDAATAEERYALEPANRATPEWLYDRRWALTLLERAQERLRDEMIVSGQLDRFVALEPTLAGERTTLPYKELASHWAFLKPGLNPWSCDCAGASVNCCARKPLKRSKSPKTWTLNWQVSLPFWRPDLPRRNLWDKTFRKNRSGVIRCSNYARLPFRFSALQPAHEVRSAAGGADSPLSRLPERIA